MSAENSIEIFDHQLVRRHRQRAAINFNKFSFLFDEVADRLKERLEEINRRFPDQLCLGNSMRAPENKADILNFTGNSTDKNYPAGIEFDEELLPFKPASFDLITSNLALHWVNDLPGAMIQMQRALKPDGLFLASMFGGDTLTELRHSLMQAEEETTGGVSPRVSPFADVRDLGGLLQRAGFALPVADSDTITVHYADPFSLLADLRGMGETNALLSRSRKPLRRDTLMRAVALYREKYGRADGRVPATFQILYMTGWHPHDSQQKPLKPGSATTSLADALGNLSFNNKAP